MIEDAIKQYQDEFYKVAYTYLRNPVDAEDALQSAYEQSMKYSHTLKDKKSIKAWLIKIIINECNGVIRQQERQRVLAAEAIKVKQVYYEAGDIDHLPLRQGLLLLGKDHRDILTLKYLLGYKQAEIARMLDIPKGTVKSRIKRGLDELRKILGGEQDE